jgi:hypothetical protein
VYEIKREKDKMCKRHKEREREFVRETETDRQTDTETGTKEKKCLIMKYIETNV